MTNQQLAIPDNSGAVAVANPRQYLSQAAKLATMLAEVINERKLWSQISGRKYVTVDGWTLLANMLGVHPIVAWSRRCTEMDQELMDGWEARVEVFNGAGLMIGAGEAMCTRAEGAWAKRDDFALRAMAQTRAISRALRNPLGFVVKLAGYDTTPAEEMPKDGEA